MLGYTVHDYVKVTRSFTGTYHADKQRRKYARLCCDSFREAVTLLYLFIYIEQYLFLPLVLRLCLKYLESLDKTYTGCKHCRKLTTEERQVLCLELVFDICTLVLCNILIRCTVQTLLPQFVNKLYGIFRRFGTFYLFTVNVGSNIRKSCHSLSPIHLNRFNNLRVKWKLLYSKIIS